MVVVFQKSVASFTSLCNFFNLFPCNLCNFYASLSGLDDLF